MPDVFLKPSVVQGVIRDHLLIYIQRNMSSKNVSTGFPKTLPMELQGNIIGTI